MSKIKNYIAKVYGEDADLEEVAEAQHGRR